MRSLVEKEAHMAQTNEETFTTITVVQNARTKKIFFYLDELDGPLVPKNRDRIVGRIRIDLTDSDDLGAVALATRFKALLDLNEAMEGAVREIILRVAEASFHAGRRIRGSPVSCA